MLASVFICSILLNLPAQTGRSSMLGTAAEKPAARSQPAEKPAAKAQPAEKPAITAAAVEPAASPDALAQYNALKATTPKNLAGHSKLAMWCEEHGLKAEANAHYAEVIRIDPRREVAWRKLGFKKYNNRWMTEAQIAEQEEQKNAARTWAPQLKKIHRDIHGSNGAKKRDQAQAAFEAIRDERAIPSLYREFGSTQTDQILLIEALVRIEKPLATKVMAMLAVYGRTPEVRRRATEQLRNRSAEDYLELLVALLTDPLKYEVKPVNGPGSTGVLFVEGEKFNMARYYTPPPPPNVIPQPGDIITYDQFGMPAVIRHVALKAGVPGSMTLAYDFNGTVQISQAEVVMEARKAAQAAEAQLEGDVALIKAMNAARRHFNELVISVATYATGKDRGPNPKDWRSAVHGDAVEKKYQKEETQKPTLAQFVPLNYQPAFFDVIFMKVRIIQDS